ncbi:MAG: Plug domain-containing protein [Ignavibacteria bacterium]|nr:Plug domain-containing protein [Ignavibacteria bacterium]
MKKIVSSLIALCCLTSVSAQTKKTSTKDSTTIREISTQEVVVTATRQKEINLEVPLAITVVPQKILENARGYGLDEVLSLVPGALVQSRSGNQDVRVTIRGFGAPGAGERSNAGTSRGLRFYQDGIPDTEPDGLTAFDLIDLSGASSIEVIRSNASALWGNAAGGIVSISTIPTTRTPFISLTNQNGSFGFMKQSLRMVPNTDAGLLYLSTNNTSFEGWRENSPQFLISI